MIFVSAGFLIIAALLGFYLLTFVLQSKETPKAIAFIHGPMAVIGLLILIAYAVISKPAPIVSIVIFVLAAMGGLTLIYKDLTGQSLPKWMAVGHGLTAVTGLVFLIVFIAQHSL